MSPPGWSSVSSFVSNRRKTFAWVAGTVGGAYLLGQWGFKKIGDIAERSRRERLETDNLARRFDLNQQDCQFTILALLPAVTPQLLGAMDVEAASAQLAQIAAQVKARERALSEAADVEQRRFEGLEATKVEEEVLPEPVAPPTTLDPAAQVFVPSGAKLDAKETSGIVANGYEVGGAEANHSEVPGEVGGEVLPNGDAGTSETSESSEGEKAQPEEETAPLTQDDGGLSKSWAEVVKTGNGDAEEVESKQEPEPVVSRPATPPPELPSRAELWNSIKILSFTRTITALYILTLLSLQTHIQLNLLGRAAYVSSVLASLPSSSSTSSLPQQSDDDLERALYALHRQDDTVTEEIERMYLTFSWWLLHRGWVGIGQRVQSAVEQVVGPLALKSTVVYGELPTLLGQIRHRVDTNPDGTPFDFSPSLFPPTPSDELLTLSSGGLLPPSPTPTTIPTPLRQLLDETRDFTDSPDGTLVRTRVLDALFSRLVEKLEGPFRPKDSGEEGGGSRFEDIGERTVRLAGLLPTVARQSHLVLNGLPNEYAEAVEDVRELSELSAIIYSSFDKDDVRRR